MILPMCYPTKFGRSRSNSIVLYIGVQIFFWWDIWAPPFGMWAWLTLETCFCHTVPNLVIILVKQYERTYGDLAEKFDPRVPLFKFTRGHQNRHGLIGYL